MSHDHSCAPGSLCSSHGIHSSSAYFPTLLLPHPIPLVSWLRPEQDVRPDQPDDWLTTLMNVVLGC